MNRPRDSVVLLSGGLDSAINLFLCAEQDQPVLALTLDYGQRAAQSEIRAAKKLCDYLNATYQERLSNPIQHRVIELPWMPGGSSALVNRQAAMPQLARGELDELGASTRSAAQVWVPNRNGVFIQIAAAIAESLGASKVIVGFNKEEAATFPDNSRAFIDAVNDSLSYSTRNQVQVKCYTDHLTKTEMIRLIQSKPNMDFPFHLVWSCYEAGEVPCEICESCQRFARARQGTC